MSSILFQYCRSECRNADDRTQKICIRYLGNGDKDKTQSSFNTTLFAGLQAGAIVTAVLVFFAGPVVSLLGATKENIELYNVSKEYLQGLS